MVKEKTYKNEIIPFLILAFLTVTVSVSSTLNQSIIGGVKLFFYCVFPTLFPYLFFTSLLSNMKITKKFSGLLSPFFKKIFNVSGTCGYAYIISQIAGQPTGTKLVCDLYREKKISETDAIRASCFTSNPSPSFLITSVGVAMFNSLKFGLLLYLTCFISSVITGMIFSFYKRKIKPENGFDCAKVHSPDFSESVYMAIKTSLFVCAVISLFYLLTAVLDTLYILYPVKKLLFLITKNQSLSNGITLGIFECTSGINALSKCGNFPLSAVAFLCGGGGICIIMQSLPFLREAKIKTAPFLFSKILSAVINFFIGLIFTVCFY